MEKELDVMEERILRVALEIMSLLSGEDYMVVRTEEGEGWSREKVPISLPTPHSLIHKGKSHQEILELINKMAELLTGEVPIRCQDLTVYFSMEEWEYVEGHKDLYQDIVMMGDHRTPTSPLDKGPTRMEKSRKNMAARILHLTLEIIHLITGEDYTVVKKWSGECVTPRVSGGSGTTQSPTPEDPPPHSLIHEQKILELTTRMTELLTGEVPIRCQDLTVYFSMEEWEYVEGHKDLYQDIVMMGDHRTPTSPLDGDKDRNPPARCSPPLYSQDCPEGNVPEMHQGGDLTVIKVEDEEERMRGHHPCMRRVKEEMPGGVTPENPNKDDDTNVILLNCKVEDEDLMQHSPGEDLLSLTVHPGAHSTDLSYNAPNHGEPSPDPSQVVTTRTDQQLKGRFNNGECEEEFIESSGLLSHIRSHTGEKTYSCSLCGKCFTDTSELLSHERMHIREKRYLCSKCGEHFVHKTDLVKHEKTHSAEMSYPCQECAKCFISKQRLAAHERMHTGVKSYPCSECGICFTSKQCLVAHERSHSEEKSYSCSECGKFFQVKYHLFIHEKSHIEKLPYLCSVCGKYFKGKGNLNRHQRIHTGEKPYSCSECGKCFTSKANLVQHEITHTGAKPYSCAECGKCYTDPSSLIKHKRSHTGEKPYPCSECGKCFTRKSLLVIHHRTHTGEKPYSCSECGKSFAAKTNLVMHVESHTGEKPYSCTECGKCFTSKLYLVRHERTHTGEQPYACSECGKCLTSKSSLVKHQRIHTGEKPYSCSECGKCFTAKEHVVRHERTHTGDKPYACSECGKCFTSKEHLVVHERNHRGEKPYSCSECGKGFSKKSHLLSHLKVHTGGKHI